MSMDFARDNRKREVTVRASKPQTARHRIFARIMDTPRGITCDEIEIRLGISHQVASAAISAMLKQGIIVDSGERRRTRTGRNAKVLRRR